MRIVIIGGSGHIGTYLVPRLVQAGHEVINISRQARKPYIAAPQWAGVKSVAADRHAEDKTGAFPRRVADLKPDAVIDNICFTPASAAALVEALRGKVRHFLLTGTAWVHGEAEVVPTPESARRRPIGQYGISKNAIEELLMAEAWRNGFPATVVHPGHIVGPGWPCVNPQGNFNLAVWQTIIDGGELTLPNMGLECLHHVHADDVAQVFQKAIQNPSQSVGESFHAVSPGAVTLLGYARAAYEWFGREPRLKFAPAGELAKTIAPADAEQTIEHISRSPCLSIEKGRRRLGYQPRYTSLEACRECIEWLLANGRLTTKQG
ncbi:MAG: NAD-dependent epimerase/dehydratase family protein [Phycisphaerae bacterium]